MLWKGENITFHTEEQLRSFRNRLTKNIDGASNNRDFRRIRECVRFSTEKNDALPQADFLPEQQYSSHPQGSPLALLEFSSDIDLSISDTGCFPEKTEVGTTISRFTITPSGLRQVPVSNGLKDYSMSDQIWCPSDQRTELTVDTDVCNYQPPRWDIPCVSVPRT